jgi:hypothetical protein
VKFMRTGDARISILAAALADRSYEGKRRRVYCLR